MAARRILTLLACGALVTPALASPLGDPTNGRAVFTGATVPHATSIELNPAALGLGTRFEVYVAATSLLNQIQIERRTLDIATGDLSPGPRVSDTQLAPGAMIAVLGHPSDRLTVGGAVYLPSPERLPEGHEPLRYHTLGGGQRNILVTAGVSLRWSNALYFGASLSHENRLLDLRYARDTALAGGPAGIASDCDGAPCGVENPVATELYDVRVRSPWLSTSNLRVNIGAVFRVYTDVWMGIAYHTPPGFEDIQTTLDGNMEVTRAPRDGGGIVRGRSTVYVSYPASLDAEIRARLPGELHLHVGGRWQDLSRLQAFDVRGFGSTFRANDIPEWVLRARGYDDSIALWAGVEQIDRGEPLRVGARIGFASSAVDTERTSAVAIAPASLTADVGVQARIAPSWVFQLSYGLSYFPTVDVTETLYDPRHTLACIESGHDYTTLACEAVRNGYGLPTAAGTYDRLEHALRLGFRYERL
jgi:hypothetical protein